MIYANVILVKMFKIHILVKTLSINYLINKQLGIFIIYYYSLWLYHFFFINLLDDAFHVIKNVFLLHFFSFLSNLVFGRNIKKNHDFNIHSWCIHV